MSLVEIVLLIRVLVVVLFSVNNFGVQSSSLMSPGLPEPLIISCSIFYVSNFTLDTVILEATSELLLGII